MNKYFFSYPSSLVLRLSSFVLRSSSFVLRPTSHVPRLSGLIFFILISLSVPAHAADSDVSNSPAAQRARQDYRVFLEQLKTLNQQYKQVTGEMSKIIKEEGVPSWDANTDSLTFIKPVETAGQIPDKNIEETDKEMTVRLDLPGLKKDSIKVSIEDVKMLRVNAVRRIAEKDIKIQKIIELPSPAHNKGTEAKYQDGVLTVRIPKAIKQEIQVPVT